MFRNLAMVFEEKSCIFLCKRIYLYICSNYIVFSSASFRYFAVRNLVKAGFFAFPSTPFSILFKTYNFMNHMRNIIVFVTCLLGAWLVLAHDSDTRKCTEVTIVRQTSNLQQATRGDDEYTAFQEVIREGMMNMQESIDVARFEMDYSSMLNAYFNLLREDFELFFVDSTAEPSGTMDSVTRLIKTIEPVYAVKDSSEKDIMLAKFRARTNQILQLAISPDLNDLGKILALHDFLCTHCSYRNYETESVKDENGNTAKDENGRDKVKVIFDFCITAYGALVNGEGNCQGQTMSMRHLLQSAGFKTRRVEPTIDYLDHTWLQVQIDGEYYNLDASSDNPRHDLDHGLEYHQRNYVTHKYFLCSNEKFLNEPEDEKAGHWRWNNPEATPATSTRFDAYFWGRADLNIDSPIPCFGDTAYISFNERLIHDDGSRFFPIYAYSLNTGECLGTVTEFTEQWKNWWSGGLFFYNYSNLLRKGNLLLFNTPTAIMAFHPGTGLSAQLNFTLPLDKGYVYGLWMDDDSEVYAILRKSSQDDDKDSAIVRLNWIQPKKITMNPAVLNLMSTEQGQVSATISPANATFPILSWKCQDDSVTVTAEEALGDNVRLVKAGDKYVQTALTATAVDNGLTGTCVIQVIPAEPSTPDNVLVLSAGWNLVTLRVLPREPQVLKQFFPRALDPANGNFIIPQKFELNRSYWFFSETDTTFAYERSSEKTAYSPMPGKSNLAGMSTSSAYFDLVGQFTDFWFWNGTKFQKITDINNLNVGQGYLVY